MSNLRIQDYLQERRIEMRLSIQQLSKESGISASHISRMERGVRNPSPKTLEKLAPSLEVDYLTLLKVSNLLDNPNNHCIDIEKILLTELCVYKEKEISEDVKNQILSLLHQT